MAEKQANKATNKASKKAANKNAKKAGSSSSLPSGEAPSVSGPLVENEPAQADQGRQAGAAPVAGRKRLSEELPPTLSARKRGRTKTQVAVEQVHASFLAPVSPAAPAHPPSTTPTDHHSVRPRALHRQLWPTLPLPITTPYSRRRHSARHPRSLRSSPRPASLAPPASSLLLPPQHPPIETSSRARRQRRRSPPCAAPARLPASRPRARSSRRRWRSTSSRRSARALPRLRRRSRPPRRASPARTSLTFGPTATRRPSSTRRASRRLGRRSRRPGRASSPAPARSSHACAGSPAGSRSTRCARRRTFDDLCSPSCTPLDDFSKRRLADPGRRGRGRGKASMG